MASEHRFVLGVDLDGTCADFYGGLRPIAAEWLGVPLESLPTDVCYGLTEWKLDKAPGGYPALHRFAVTQRDLFSILKPMPGAPMVLRRLSELDIRIRIITHRLFIKYFHRDAVTQTIEWLDHHDIPYWDLCFLKDKAAAGANLYVEDMPDNILKLRADGHPTVCFGNSTNREIERPRAETWEEVEQLVLEEMDRWRHKDQMFFKELSGE